MTPSPTHTAVSSSVPTIRFYYDPISPFAWLAFARLSEALMGIGHELWCKPVFLPAMLKEYKHLGPAEIPVKRDWTYRHVLWLGRTLEVPLQMPTTHPFNPLPILRLALATATQPQPELGVTNRYVTETVFRHVWANGGDALDPQRLADLQQHLADHMAQRGAAWADPNGETVRQLLRSNTAEALAAGAFGVPTCVVNGQLFWGLDSLPMLRDHLLGRV